MSINIGEPLVGTSLPHAFFIAAVLFAITVPIALTMAKRYGQRWLAPLILAALGLHFLGSVLQVIIVRIVYSNVADFNRYNGQGALLAETWRSGTLSFAGLNLDVPGTGMVSILSGVVYSVVGIDQLGGFFVYTWFSLLGLLAFYRAFLIVLPTGNHKRYAVLLLLLPSLFYWPSAAGKEAVMMLSLGLMTLGFAHIFTGRWTGLAPLLAGSILGGLVRPHEVAMLFGSFAVGLLTRRTLRRSLVAPVRWAATFVVMGVVGAGLFVVTADFLGISPFDINALVQTLTDQNEVIQEEAGSGSSYLWNPSPLYYPVDVYYVLFKPLPFEVTSATQAFAAMENLTIMALLAASWRSLASVPRRMRESPFVVMCVVYSLGFIYVFSALGNVGLVARERTLLFPLLFVLLALPTAAKKLTLDQPAAQQRFRRAPQPVVTSASLLD